MVAAGEGPDIPVEVRKKFDDDGIFGARNEIALGDLKFVLLERAGFWKQLVACAGGKNQEVRGMPLALHAIARLFRRGIHRYDTRTVDGTTGFARAVEQQAIKHGPRVNDDGVRHLEPGPLLVAGNQIDRMNQLLGIGVVEQKRKALNGFVSQPAAAGLFPGEMFVKDFYRVTGAGKLFATDGTGRTATDDCNLCHKRSRL